MADYLTDIVAYHRRRAALDDESFTSLLAGLDAIEARPSLRSALLASAGLGVVAEFKRRSPSKGWFVEPETDVATRVSAYERAGAVAISVLTDTPHFGGTLADLERAAQHVELPIVRKDFIVDARELLRARRAGASAVLLIAAALQPEEVASLAGVAHDVGLEVLLEIHELSELELAELAAADVVGVNQRDLTSFRVDTDRARRVLAALPPGAARLAESGVRGPDDLAGLVGFDGVLIGEACMRARDPYATVRALVERGASVHQDLRHHESV